MCGFVGFSNFQNNSDTTNNVNILKKMNNKLLKKGPDEEGYYINKNVFLGHRRLIVIDPENGKQPMIESYSYGIFIWRFGF